MKGKNSYLFRFEYADMMRSTCKNDRTSAFVSGIPATALYVMCPHNTAAGKQQIN
jgi:hypothetical protein